MEVTDLNPEQQLALAQIRVATKQYAPEVDESEIVPNALLRENLGFDVTTHWAVATELERLAKIELTDSAIARASTVSDLITLLAPDTADNQSASATCDIHRPSVSDVSTPGRDAADGAAKAQQSESSFDAALNDLAALFGNN